MKIQGTHTFNAPRNLVWSILRDPDVLTKVMPGCEKLEEVAENQYSGILKIKVGPVQGKFKGKIELSDIQDPESYNITVDGKGAPGIIKGTGSLQLIEDGATTIMEYDGDAQVNGRLASVGQRLLDSSAKAIIRQSLEGFDQQIQARVTANITPEDNGSATVETAVIPPPEAPSQRQFATGVAKNMLEDMVPTENRNDFFTKAAFGISVFLLLRYLIEWWSNLIATKVAQKIREED